MDHFEIGQPIEVRDAFGNWLPRRALSDIEEGYDFPVVWACRVEEWAEAEAEGRSPDGSPWPAEDVRAAQLVDA
jgi:hypothetical protein